MVMSGFSKKEILVHGIDVTIVQDITPTGNKKYIHQISEHAGNVFDRMQRFYDYRIGQQVEIFTHEGRTCLKSGYAMLAFSTLPIDNNRIFAITVKCEQRDLSPSEAMIQIEKGFKEAIGVYNSRIKKL
jgi:hypothetical protein